MLLTLTTTHQPAEDLGWLLHKHPGRVQAFPVASGVAHVFYPQVGPEGATVALLLEVDPLGLVRGRRVQPGQRGGGPPDAFALGQFVNDRPYAASSLLAAALGRVFRTALAGRCDARPELAARTLPLRVRVPALACRSGGGGGPELVRRVFEPLGWGVEAEPVPLDEAFPQWGASRYVDLTLTGQVRLADALSHLYVLLPVLDDAKHYWVSGDEVDKLLRAGEGWLAAHPERDLITRRYLAHKGALYRSALERLADVDDVDVEELDNATEPAQVETPERIPLVQQRHSAVLEAVRLSGAHRVGDLGCGDGALVAKLLTAPGVSFVLGADVSARALAGAARRLRLDRMPERQRERVTLLQSSLTYRDVRLRGLDAAVLMEVVEHLDPPRLAALERSVFGDARPGTVIVTTPNIEHNVRYTGLPAGQLRHRDHRFEWTRAEFAAWCARVGAEHGYGVALAGVGEDDPEVGPPTQLAVFSAVSSAVSSVAFSAAGEPRRTEVVG